MRRAPGKSRKRRKKAFFLRYPQICLNPHLLNPHLRHSNRCFKFIGVSGPLGPLAPHNANVLTCFHEGHLHFLAALRLNLDIPVRSRCWDYPLTRACYKNYHCTQKDYQINSKTISVRQFLHQNYRIEFPQQFGKRFGSPVLTLLTETH